MSFWAAHDTKYCPAQETGGPSDTQERPTDVQAMCLCVGGQAGEHQCASPSPASGIPSPWMAGRQLWAGSKDQPAGVGLVAARAATTRVSNSQALPGGRALPSSSLQGFQEQQMGSSAPTVISHLPGMQRIIISHPSVQLVLHPWISRGCRRRAVGRDIAERGWHGVSEEWAAASGTVWVVL